jgi:aminocarboxymuconate-semialdehyde decarboxylase
MIGTQPKGGSGCLDDADLDPFWAAAAELGATIIVHPEFGSDDNRLHDMGMMNACGRVTDVTIALSRLLLSGHMTRFAGLKLVASTGGGALPYMVGRLSRNAEIDPGGLSDPVESLKLMHFDSIVFRTDAMNYLTNLVGSDRVMLGSDTPFPIGDYNPRRVIEESGYSDTEQDAMRGGTAAALFGIN